MRMIFTKHFSHDTGRLLVLAAGGESKIVHTIQHPAVHRLKSIPYIGQGSRHDNGHGVIDIRRFHLRLDIDLHYPAMIYFFVFYHITYLQTKR